MLKAVIFASLLTVFCGVQLVQSLECYYFVRSGDVRKGFTDVTCNEQIAQETSQLLSQFRNVQDVNSENFECISYNRTDGDVHTEIRSCAFREIHSCFEQIGGAILYSTSCMSCNQDLCN